MPAVTQGGNRKSCLDGGQASKPVRAAIVRRVRTAPVKHSQSSASASTELPVIRYGSRTAGAPQTQQRPPQDRPLRNRCHCPERSGRMLSGLSLQLRPSTPTPRNPASIFVCVRAPRACVASLHAASVTAIDLRAGVRRSGSWRSSLLRWRHIRSVEQARRNRDTACRTAVNGHAIAECGDLLRKCVARFSAQPACPFLERQPTASYSRRTSSSVIVEVCLNGERRAAWRISSE